MLEAYLEAYLPWGIASEKVLIDFGVTIKQAETRFAFVFRRNFKRSCSKSNQTLRICLWERPTMSLMSF